MKKHEFKCALCGCLHAKEILRIHKPDRFEQSVGIKPNGYSRSWVECTQCGGATNLLPAESAALLATLRGAYYEVDFLGSDITQKYHHVMSMPASQSDNVGRVTRITEFVRRWSGKAARLRVMDIGAGTGVFLSRLVDQTNGEWQYLGIEPDPRAASHLLQLKKFSVIADLYQGQAELRGFNLVTLNKVLEHIEEPSPFLGKVALSLDPNDGLLYVEVPDKLTTQLRSSQDNILGALHCHLYDPSSLTHLLNCAGLELLQLGRIAEPSGKLSVYAFAANKLSVMKKGLPHE